MKLKILKALNKFYFHILTSTSFGCYVSKYRISPFLCFRSYAAYDYLRLPVKIKTIPVLNTTPSIFDFFFSLAGVQWNEGKISSLVLYVHQLNRSNEELLKVI